MFSTKIHSPHITEDPSWVFSISNTAGHGHNGFGVPIVILPSSLTFSILIPRLSVTWNADVAESYPLPFTTNLEPGLSVPMPTLPSDIIKSPAPEPSTILTPPLKYPAHVREVG